MLGETMDPEEGEGQGSDLLALTLGDCLANIKTSITAIFYFCYSIHDKSTAAAPSSRQSLSPIMSVVIVRMMMMMMMTKAQSKES